MVISQGVIGSDHLSGIFDSEPVNATKLLIGVSLDMRYVKEAPYIPALKGGGLMGAI
jgi:hypothetical protein